MKLISILVSLAYLFSMNISTINVENSFEIFDEMPTEAATVYDENIFSEDELTNDDEEVFDEYVYCSVDASTVSAFEIIDNEEILFNGENCAEILVSLIESYGLEPVYYGTTDEDFYLSGIKGLDTEKMCVNEALKPFLEGNKVIYENNVSESGVLGEFDFTESAGWIYTVNGEIPDVGMNSYIPEPGDEIKLIFTLYYGEDIYLLN